MGSVAQKEYIARSPIETQSLLGYLDKTNVGKKCIFPFIRLSDICKNHQEDNQNSAKK